MKINNFSILEQQLCMSRALQVVFAMVMFGTTPMSGFADTKSDFYIQQAADRFFTLPQDARSLAMGGAASLVCKGVGCVYMNPAGLGFVTHPEVGASAGIGSTTGSDFLGGEDIELEEWSGYVAGVIPLGVENTRATYGSVSIAYSRYAGNTDDTLSTTPDGHRRSVAYGYAFDNELAVGYAFHFLDDQLRSDLSDVHSHARFFHDFAIQSLQENGATIAASFKLGIGQTDTEDFLLGSDGVSHLRQYTGEIAYSYPWERLTGVVAAHYTRQSSRADPLDFSKQVVIDGNESGNDYILSTGVEYELLESLLLRGGLSYRYTDFDFERPKLQELSGRLSALSSSVGLGYAFSILDRPATLDYGFAYSDAGNGAWEHLLSVALQL